MKLRSCAVRAGLLAGVLGAALPALAVDLGTAPASDQFTHEAHLALRLPGGGERLVCKSCHVPTGDAKSSLMRPGAAQHAPCDTCHLAAFLQPPGPLCSVCHEETKPLAQKMSPLLPYPRAKSSLQLLSEYSHRWHLSRALPEGGAMGCDTCHQVSSRDAVMASFPSHAECARCHQADRLQPARPYMSACAGCHAREAPGRVRHFAANQIRFTHGRHQADRRGRAVGCVDCHESVARRDRAADLPLPKMADCARCHENAARTPDRVRIARCETCHLDDARAKPSPESHRPPPEGALARPRLAERKPEDHSPLFRTRHARAAAAPDATCRYCHDGVSGTPVNGCADCHAVMRPRSHRARYRSVGHGRDAAKDPRRCATCHETDYCTACHSIPPENHFPLRLFRAQHAQSARSNPRACLTCHTFQATCQECHLRTIQGGLRQ